MGRTKRGITYRRTIVARVDLRPRSVNKRLSLTVSGVIYQHSIVTYEREPFDRRDKNENTERWIRKMLPG